MIMKTNSKVFVLLCGCILAATTMLTSCEDFLKEQNYGSPTKEEMTANESTIVLMVGQAYADVKWLHDHWGYWGVNLLTTDEGVCPVRTPGNHWADAGYWKNLNTHNWNAFGPAFENIWNTTISGAVLCNKLIYTLQGCKDVMSEANYNRYISELEVLRSYYYYMLFDCFGRIPYQEDFGAQTEPLMEPYAVWTHLVLCLEANKDKLPAVGKDVSREELYGRCSQGFAYALLARLYLNAESFGCTPENVNLVKSNEKAEKSLLEEAGVHIASVTDFYTYAAQRCESLIGGSVGDYQIEPNFFNNFLIKNENSKENIFVIVEDGSADFDYRDYAGSMANKLRVTMLTLHYCHQNTWDLIEKPWNGFCARSSFIKRYNEEDSRGPGNEGKGTKNVKQWGWFEGPVYEQLDEAYKYGTPGSFTTLQTTVSNCQTFLAGDLEGYAPNAICELQDELLIAEKELQAARASQALIDEYVSTLKSLLSAAKAAKNYTPKKVFAETSDHGFAHPGGIVSQQDIDRAKQLLASGDTRIKQAWDILCANEYSNANIATWPTEIVIRGGSSGQNYMNCARGAAMAYQNALRWKIGGTKANADAAVRILMQWARQCKGLGGDTNVSLAAGIYGHEFANAAELMRDYDGWSREDFEEFKQWIIRVFYNPAIDFLRRRHDTWLNSRNASLGERPGHYWSNWGLCNALCVMSIGILCDDVHMYNQGVSFYKYDHVGTYKDRSAETVILNDGCDEFIGNLVPVVHADSRGPLGYLGQMQESGRDQGHALMALGLALDICTVGFNQGDDLFAYMNDRIAAGTEFVAAMNFGGVDAADLPWTNYNYADCRGRMGASWLMEGPNTGGAGE